MLQGVSENTYKVLEQLMEYQELEKYFLVGGTALSIQLKHRLSEDLDIFCFNPYPGKRLPLPNFSEIFKKFKKDFSITHLENADEYSIRCRLNGIKIDLHSENQFHGPKTYSRLGKIRLPDKFSLLGMKLVALTLRDQWRDIYDLTCLKKEFKEEDFFKAYVKIMSSVYCGKKAGRKEALFNSTMMKLQDSKLLKRLYKADNLAHLNINHQITPEMVLSDFDKFPKKEIKNSRGLSL